MTAERMFREYKNLKKEQGILLFQLEQFSGIEESDVIDSMMFGHADDNDRVQTSNRWGLLSYLSGRDIKI